MNRKMLLGVGLAGASLLSIPLVATAQTPPEPPATFYGAATGATIGQGVVAIVIDGSTSTPCGSGAVQSDASGPVYVVDVITDAQVRGCGANGRQVRFYFTPTSSSAGRLANETASWSGSGAKSQALTPGAPLTLHSYVPFTASDKTSE